MFLKFEVFLKIRSKFLSTPCWIVYLIVKDTKSTKIICIAVVNIFKSSINNHNEWLKLILNSLMLINE
jgi:hypothetical protein